MSRRRLAPWAVLPLVASALLGGAAAAGSEGLLFYEEDGSVVFTNTPSRADARPVPGFEAEDAPAAAAVGARANLPRTIYDSFIERVAAENGLSPALVKAVALVESGFDPHAESHKGAQGLMQLMPATARRYGVDDAFDPLQNLRAGAMHLRDLLDEFRGDLTLALAAYNAGAGAVRRHGGIPAYRETQDYVRKVRGRLDGRAPERRRKAPPRAPAVRVVHEADGSIRQGN